MEGLEFPIQKMRHFTTVRNPYRGYIFASVSILRTYPPGQVGTAGNQVGTHTYLPG